jgi:hypothetical protein
LLRVIRQKAIIVPKRMANGMICCAMCGCLSAAISSRTSSVASGLLPPRRISSM